MLRKSIIVIPQDGIQFLIPAKHVHVSELETPLPPCQWCKCSSLKSILEYCQLGFDDDKWTVICGCDDCQNATVFEFALAH